MELVVAEVQRRVDRLERLKVNVHLLFFALLCDYSTAVDYEAVRRYWNENTINYYKETFDFIYILGRILVKYTKRYHLYSSGLVRVWVKILKAPPSLTVVKDVYGLRDYKFDREQAKLL